MNLDIPHVDQAIAPLGLGKVAQATEMAGGSSPAFRLDLDTGTSLVLKVYADRKARAPGGDAFASAQVQGIGVPVTRYLLVDDSRNNLPFRFAITNYLPGVLASTLAGHPDIASLYRQMGALLRSLHSISMPAFGWFDAVAIKIPAKSNTTFVRGQLDHAFAKFTAYGADARLAASLRQMADSSFDAVVPHSAGAAFAHDDLHPNNVLAVDIDGKLSLSGLIDFGNAYAAAPVSDLAKCLFCSEHEAPGSTRYILDGYGPIDHHDPEAALSFYTLLHRITMWWWLRHIGVIPTPDAPSDIMDDLRRTADQ
jgi:Ser/Thr protein kinase RdoA (MazF antagonist)